MYLEFKTLHPEVSHREFNLSMVSRGQVWSSSSLILLKLATIPIKNYNDFPPSFNFTFGFIEYCPNEIHSSVQEA